MDNSLDSKPTGKAILIVDDEFGVLEVVEFILTDLGYSVISALNGRDALMRIGEKIPDLILLDFMMPIMDGAAALKAIRSDTRYCNIPVILTSALPEQTIKEKCPGYNLFLRKPYKFEALTSAVNSLLKQQPNPDGVPAPGRDPNQSKT
ncbi:MAG: response regulator [Candidatus Binataceae bacterium]|jgi:CheY-like chemotaxis protein